MYDQLMKAKCLIWLCLALAGVTVPGAWAVGAEGVLIGHGTRGDARWTATVRAASTGESAKSACLDAFVQVKGVGSEATECGAVRNSLPLFNRLALGRGKQRLTVFSAVMPPEAQRVALSLGSRGLQKMRVRHLGSETAKRLDIQPFAYLARAFSGPVCIRRFRAYDGDEALLTDIAFIRCHES
jgi:hypothetical protein